MMHRIDQNRGGATQRVKNVDPGQLLGYMMHHIMMQHISKKLTWIVEVDDAFHCDDGTMRLFLAILSVPVPLESLLPGTLCRRFHAPRNFDAFFKAFLNNILSTATQAHADADEKMTEPAMTRPIPHHHDRARGSKNQIRFSDPVSGSLCLNRYN